MENTPRLQELFSGSTADGSFMQDPSTAAELDQDDIVVHDIMNDMANYDKADDPHGQDSEKWSLIVMIVKRWVPSQQLVAKFLHLVSSP
ncbi:hypothetical protein U9M48_009301 [Paspalum notatum var. saurae]|uniref:Uncharacterized protein n=1 Tax=Paspalum notatum var. saurae TaxID=547442 RepID=A0AAQ3SQQ8_PASNO